MYIINKVEQSNIHFKMRLIYLTKYYLQRPWSLETPLKVRFGQQNLKLL